jgi:hypothetical protein
MHTHTRQYRSYPWDAAAYEHTIEEHEKLARQCHSTKWSGSGWRVTLRRASTRAFGSTSNEDEEDRHITKGDTPLLAPLLPFLACGMLGVAVGVLGAYTASATRGRQ